MVVEWWVSYTTPVSTLMLHYPLQVPGQAGNGVLQPYMVWVQPSSLPFPIPIESKSDSTSLWAMNYFPFCNAFLTDESLVEFHSTIAICTHEFTPVIKFTAKTNQVTHIIANPLNFILISLVTCKIHEPSPYENDFQEAASVVTTILIYLSRVNRYLPHISA